MKERIFGAEAEYALYFHQDDHRPASVMGGEKLLDFLKGLNALLVASLERTGIAHAGEFLGNGGRFYIDRGGHPEYATPECRRIPDLVAHEKAGDRLVQRLTVSAREQMQKGEGPDDSRRFKIYKNNIDGYGATYGGHENYLITAAGMENVEALIAFLATRQIYTGSGKATGKLPEQDVPYQISQRADFFNRVFSDRTSETRGIINTRRREIPKLGEDRRLHIICGDCNMSEYAIALKFGVTAILARMLEEGALEKFPKLLYPVKAMKQVSRDLYALLDLAGKKGKTTALEVQRFYLEKAFDFFASNEISDEEQSILKLWQETLEDFDELEFSPRTGELEYAPESLGRRVDWLVKLWLIDRYRKKGGLAWNDRHLIALDFQYHDLDPAEGFFQRCLSMGLIDRLIGDEDVEEALKAPPSGTRAAIRGKVIQETMGRNVDVVVENWEKIAVRARNRDNSPVHPFIRNRRIMNALELSMKDPFLAEDPEFMEKLGRFIKTWG